MRLLIAVLVILSLASIALCAPVSSSAPGPAILFVEGFAYGIEVEIGNATDCINDGAKMMNDFETGFKDISTCFSSKNVNYCIKGFKEFGAGLQELSIGFQVCGVGALAEDIARIAKELQSGPEGILKFIISEIVNIFHHNKEITKDIQNAIKYWQAKDYKLCGVQVGEITGILLENK